MTQTHTHINTHTLTQTHTQKKSKFKPPENSTGPTFSFEIMHTAAASVKHHTAPRLITQSMWMTAARIPAVPAIRKKKLKNPSNCVFLSTLSRKTEKMTKGGKRRWREGVRWRAEWKWEETVSRKEKNCTLL